MVERSVKESLGEKVLAATPPEKVARLIESVNKKVEAAAEARPAVPAQISAEVATSQVKERADAVNVTRVKITLQEEGLEWSAGESSDGSSKRRLSPE